jgi:uncharacterized protein (DUF58 family)
MSLYPRLDDLLELRHATHTLGLSSRHLVNSSFTGLYASVFRGAGVNFEEVREYREGDDIRNMDWKVTARTNSPHLKVYREERERSVVLCVDKGPHMGFGTRGTFKNIQAARAAALIGWAASRLHDRVGGIAFGDDRAGLQHFRPTPGRQSLWRLLRTLAEPGPESARSIDCLAGALQRASSGLSTGSLMFLIADLNRDVISLEQILGNLIQRHTVVLIPVDDPADWEIPEMGHITFSGTDGELIEIDTADRAARQAYAGAWQARRNALLSVVHRLGLFFQPVRTDEDVHKTLMQGLQERARWRTL